MTDRSGFRFRTFSLVIVAKNHNPSLLNPDFLRIRDIVPHDYELIEPSITTPPVAIVKYKQGISIMVAMEKLQVVEIIKERFPQSLSAPQIASRYVQTLPHVRYTGVGINWGGALRTEDPDVWMSNRFLSQGPWRENSHKLIGSELRFKYALADAQCNLSLASDTISERDTAVPVVTVNVNFHHEITAYPADEAVAQVIERWADRLDHFRTLIRDVLGVELAR